MVSPLFPDGHMYIETFNASLTLYLAFTPRRLKRWHSRLIRRSIVW